MSAVTFHSQSLVGGWLMMGFLFVLFVAAIITTIAMLDRNEEPPRKPYRPDTASAPRRILEERFARGELDEDEYMKKLSLLG